MTAPRYSIVIPCHNEAARIGALLRAAHDTLSDIPHELIVVIDGCSDASESVVRDVAGKIPEVRMLVHPTRLGKGGAIRRGILDARGAIIAFIDGDGEIDPMFIKDAFLAINKEKVDIVIGTRHGKNAAYHTTIPRRFTSWAYQTIVWMLFGLDVIDTQCGLKVFTEPVAKKLFTLSNINGYAFDIDVLVHALWAGYRINQIPIVQVFKGTSTITLPHVLQMMSDTCDTYDRHVREIFAHWSIHKSARTAHLVRSFLFLPFTTIIAFGLKIVIGSKK